MTAPLDVRLPKPGEADESVDTVAQPDVLVVCDAVKLDRRGVRGAPVRLPESRRKAENVRLLEYGKPDVFELLGETPVGVLRGVAIAGDALVARLPEPEH